MRNFHEEKNDIVTFDTTGDTFISPVGVRASQRNTFKEHIGVEQPYLKHLNITGRKPPRRSILLALPPATRQGLDDLDPVSRLEGQSLLVLVPAKGV